MVRGKQGWIRIFEATLAILLISGVLVYVNTLQVSSEQDSSESIYALQREALRMISLQENLRQTVLADVECTEDPAAECSEGILAAAFPADSALGAKNFLFRICDLSEVCPVHPEDFIAFGLVNHNVFVEEAVIVGDLAGSFERKKVRLFVWENN